MRDQGLQGVCRRKWVTTTVLHARDLVVPDLVDRDFYASAPDELWVAGATYIRTWEGFLNLATALDEFSRRIVGWSMAKHLRTVLDAIKMALARRKPEVVINHSDGIALHVDSIRESVLYDPQWGRCVTVTTMRCVRVSLLRGSAT